MKLTRSTGSWPVLLLWVLFTNASLSFAQECVSAAEADVLLATSWAAQAGWNTSTEVAAWPGVQCDFDASGLNM